VRAIYDVDNRLSVYHNEKDCNNNGDHEGLAWVYLFDEVSCKNYLMQTVDFCKWICRFWVISVLIHHRFAERRGHVLLSLYDMGHLQDTGDP
jgi:hypothetical protein